VCAASWKKKKNRKLEGSPKKKKCVCFAPLVKKEREKKKERII
jgi:hypothetical protein